MNATVFEAIPMTSKITSNGVILFAKISVALICAWPPSAETTKTFIILFKMWWFTSYLSSILLLFPLLNSVYEDRDDPVILAKSICLSCAVLQVTVKMMICRTQYTCFQMLYHKMETFCKRADEKANIMLQHYIDKYKYVYGTYILSCYLTAIGVICGPLVLPEQLPTPAKYPFSVEEQPIKSIIYLHQSIVGLQAAAGICIEVNIVILLMYSSVRLDLLGQKIRNVRNEFELDTCIQLHSEILSIRQGWQGVEHFSRFSRPLSLLLLFRSL